MKEKTKQLTPYLISAGVTFLIFLVLFMPYVAFLSGYSIMNLFYGFAGVMVSLFQIFLFLTMILLGAISCVGILQINGFVKKKIIIGKYDLTKINECVLLIMAILSVLSFMFSIIVAATSSTMFGVGSIFSAIFICGGYALLKYLQSTILKPESKAKVIVTVEPDEE
ncbi:MAG: hypothetical protein RR140_02350 [Clostridia bacterium]